MNDTLRNYESDTPETCEAVEHWQQGKINIFDEMARLERDRDQWRECADKLAEALFIELSGTMTLGGSAHSSLAEFYRLKEAGK